MATFRLSALGLVARYSDNPKTPPQGVRLLPTMLPRAVLDVDPNVLITLTGAQANAEAGNVAAFIAAQEDALGQVGPLGLHMPSYGVFSKTGNVTVTLIGAEARAQAEELEGTSITITLDGATAFASAGTVVADTPIVPDVVIIRHIQFAQTNRSIGIQMESVTTPTALESKVTSVSKASRSTQITIASKHTTITQGSAGILINVN